MTKDPFVLARQDAPSFWRVDTLWTVLASGDTTGGELSVFDQVMPRRSGPPPHVHPRLHEYFYLLDGEIKFQVGDEVHTAGAGTMVSVPPGCAHAFTVVTETVRALNLYTPGGFTEQLSWLGTPATELRLPTPAEQTSPDDERFAAYLHMSAELNTQTWLAPEQVPDLLAEERDPPSVT